MKTLEDVLLKKKQALIIENLSKDIESHEFDLKIISIIDTVDKVRLTIRNSDGVSNYIDIELSAQTIIDILKGKIEYKKQTLEKLLKHF